MLDSHCSGPFPPHAAGDPWRGAACCWSGPSCSTPASKRPFNSLQPHAVACETIWNGHVRVHQSEAAAAACNVQREMHGGLPAESPAQCAGYHRQQNYCIVVHAATLLDNAGALLSVASCTLRCAVSWQPSMRPSLHVAPSYSSIVQCRGMHSTACSEGGTLGCQLRADARLTGVGHHQQNGVHISAAQHAA